MIKAVYLEWLEFARRKTLEFLDGVATRPDAEAILKWRPAPGRAHIAWQLMHLAATDDRHLNVRMKGGEPSAADLVKRFAGGSVPDDDIPALADIRSYMMERRTALLEHLRSLEDSQLGQKPNATAPWTYQEWLRVLAWHESHHQGQAHLTFNLYRAAHDAPLKP